MPYKKTHPGLDETLTEADLGFLDEPAGTDLLVLPAARAWPWVVLAGFVGVVIGIVAGVIVAPYATVAEVALVLVGVAAGATVVMILDRYDR